MRRDRSPAHPRPGDTVIVGAAASVQFARDRGLVLRVIRVDDRMTYRGWVWLTGFVLARDGTATEKREIFVRRAGLRWGTAGPKVPRRRPEGRT